MLVKNARGIRRSALPGHRVDTVVSASYDPAHELNGIIQRLRFREASAPVKSVSVAQSPSIAELERLSVQARRLIVSSIHKAGAGHLGGPLSATDLLIHLYFNQLRIDPNQPQLENRDRFILSKGHASIALYVV